MPRRRDAPSSSEEEARVEFLGRLGNIRNRIFEQRESAPPLTEDELATIDAALEVKFDTSFDPTVDLDEVDRLEEQDVLGSAFVDQAMEIADEGHLPVEDVVRELQSLEREAKEKKHVRLAQYIERTVHLFLRRYYGGVDIRAN